jgi:Lrp/AsnC family transcriptional regulator, regulator for asnA, asnC and gidA
LDSFHLAPADIRIIQCLTKDARSSIAKIAEQLEIPESTVRHRVNRLVRGGVIEFAVMTNPLHLGYGSWAIIEIQVELKKIRAVARRLARIPEVYFVGITTGGYDLLVGAVFRSNEELLDFVTGRLAHIPGIIRTSTSSVLELVKRNMTFGLPVALMRNTTKPLLKRRRREPAR